MSFWTTISFFLNFALFVADYYRAQACFGLLALFMIVANSFFAIYTFTHHRYIYKRLVAGIFLITGR